MNHNVAGQHLLACVLMCGLVVAAAGCSTSPQPKPRQTLELETIHHEVATVYLYRPVTQTPKTE